MTCWSSFLSKGSKDQKLDWLDGDDDKEASGLLQRSVVGASNEDASAAVAVVAASKPPPPPPTTTPVLLEVVGCMGLSSTTRQLSFRSLTNFSGTTVVDPYCKVTLKGKEVHRTKTLNDNVSPIYTVKSQSLCILEIPNTAAAGGAPATSPGSPTSTSSDSESEDGSQQQVATTTKTTNEKDDEQVVVSVYHGSKCLGRVCLTFADLLDGSGEHGEREEFPLDVEHNEDNDGTESKATLALRFRTATRQDLIFLGKLPKDEQKEECLASDINFHNVKGKNLLAFRQRMVKDQQEYIRVLPFPDPDRPKEETEWMTQEDLLAECLKPSKSWVSAGHGTTGKVYLEILGCDDLAEMDTGVTGDHTDAFVGILMEDVFLRTNVVWDNLSPRWMPWTNRAFELHVQHPSSILMLGVFDYDESFVDHHDPVGRVVINLANFRCNTEYILHYKLHLDPREEDERGTITIRLRIDWYDESEAMKRSFKAPPRFIVNVENDKGYRVLRFLTRGALDMEQATVASCKLYAKELVSYWKDYCFLLDVLMEVLLWRGRVSVTETWSVWFPIHSILLFSSVVVVLERPDFAVPIFLYGISWILLSVNYHASRHPYPWKRVKKSEEINAMALFGRSKLRGQSIEPGEGVEEGDEVDKLDKLKAQRMSSLIYAFLMFLSRANKIYGRTSMSSFNMTTQTSEWKDWSFLSSKLVYVHMMLKMLCLKIRLVRNFVNWKSYTTDVFTTDCIFVATLWLILPANTVFYWVLRILAWSLLGPWMKLVDVYLVHPWFETKEELLELLRREDDEDPKPKMPDFNSILESNLFVKMIHSGRVMAEDALKLKDMREKIFGYYCETIPKADSSRFPSVPLPASSALCLSPDQKPSVKHSYIVPGQTLEGNMIHRRVVCPGGAVIPSAAAQEQAVEESKKEK